VPVNATERVVGQMGPGSARDVLAELLDGSHFNYVILGSATDSTKVERVLLSLKPPPSLENAVQAPVNVASTPLAPGDQQAGDDDDDASEAPGDQPNQPPTQPPVRTPEQLLQELQRQQQQQQQQQQPGQPPAPAPPQRN